MKDPIQILKKYWGYSSFRNFQKEAINAVIDQKDTLLVLPTGGGKSLCYQIPAIVLGGVTIVISPLIALMEDQVQQLQSRGINAAFWHSGMSQREQNLVLNNLVYTREYLLFYVSPERFNSSRFLQLVQQVKVSLIAIDEAHCISQWGYNFRPAYLQIGNFREHYPQLPFIALTATATESVTADIKEKLLLNNPLVFRSSILKDHLALYVYEEGDKHKLLANFVLELEGSGIIYIRNRAGTESISSMLSSLGCNCTYFHAGMERNDRLIVMEKWLSGEYQFIVATNAFGMGIDKDNVRWIVHMSPPPTIEEYYQEIGRAGRDGLPCKSYLLWNAEDIEQGHERIETKYPSPDGLRSVLRMLVDYFQIPVSNSYYRKYFNFLNFVDHFPLSYTRFHYAFRLLDQLGVLVYVEPRPQMASVIVHKAQVDLPILQHSQPKLHEVLSFLMRSYSNIFWSEVEFSISELAFELNMAVLDLEHRLKVMHKMKILDYYPEGEYALIEFPEGRPVLKNLNFDHKFITDLKEREQLGWNQMIEFVENEGCKFNHLQKYFGEEPTLECGHCCSEYIRWTDQEKGLDEMYHVFKQKLEQQPYRVYDLILSEENEYMAKEAIRALYRHKVVSYKNDLLYLNEKT
ncbi:RecQ family ATP-dependent DNA helicase [Membranihabitans marinus]|uniref:RecQ family ATP-dependent DNA helicase n=1 Tax=Membranihabitans marinus TaxID=1227546 RepID=UPI001F2B0B79|nr:ATP-dependent DNA helicase RecQ [Membranihabitans marinus]